MECDFRRTLFATSSARAILSSTAVISLSEIKLQFLQRPAFNNTLTMDIKSANEYGYSR
jgi:hypothetical protein